MIERDYPVGTLRRFFSGLTESTFCGQLGIVDPQLVDYVSELLVRFVRCEDIFSVRNPTGQRLTQVVEMVAEAEARTGAARRTVHRHIGDFTLFWTGVYPEMLPRLRRAGAQDSLVDYCAQGKRAYFIASTLPVEPEATLSGVLGRLSQQFELCAYGLSEVRRQWEQREGDSFSTLLIN